MLVFGFAWHKLAPGAAQRHRAGSREKWRAGADIGQAVLLAAAVRNDKGTAVPDGFEIEMQDVA